MGVFTAPKIIYHRKDQCINVGCFFGIVYEWNSVIESIEKNKSLFRGDLFVLGNLCLEDNITRILYRNAV